MGEEKSDENNPVIKPNTFSGPIISPYSFAGQASFIPGHPPIDEGGSCGKPVFRGKC